MLLQSVHENGKTMNLWTGASQNNAFAEEHMIRRGGERNFFLARGAII